MRMGVATIAFANPLAPPVETFTNAAGGPGGLGPLLLEHDAHTTTAQEPSARTRAREVIMSVKNVVSRGRRQSRGMLLSGTADYTQDRNGRCFRHHRDDRSPNHLSGRLSQRTRSRWRARDGRDRVREEGFRL